MKSFLAFFIVILMIFALCGCGGSDPAVTPEPVLSPEPTPEPTSTPIFTTYRSHGKLVPVYSVPERVVTAGPNCTEVFCALGLADKVIGKCMENHSLGALSGLANTYASIPTLSIGYPTLDDILKSGCDFLYASSWIFNDSLTVEALEAEGILVYVNDADTLDELWEQYRDLGRIFDVEDTAEELRKSEKDRLIAVGAVLAETEPKSVLVVDSFIDELVYTAGSGNIETEYIKAADCINVFSDLKKPWDAVTPKDIEKANPYFLIIHDYSGSDYASKVEALKADPILNRLDCVRNGRILRLPLENMMPGVRSAVTVESIAYTIHYESFAAQSRSTGN